MMKTLRNYILTLLCMILASACSQEQPEPNTTQGQKTARIRLSAPLGSRPKDAVSEYELIQYYRVVFATVDGTIARCIDGECDPAVELDPIETTLGLGTYHVYGFANIDRDYLDGLGLHEGGQVPGNISNIRYFMPEPFSSTELLPVESMTKPIPMTSARQSITVTGRNQTFGIEVRRLFAKLEFVFSNPTNKDMQLASQSISNLTINGASGNGSILLMNYQEPVNSLNLPSPCPMASLTHTYATPLALSAGTTGVSQAFYVLESRSEEVSNSFFLDFDVRTTENPTEEGFRYALTDPNTFTLIHRNDWIRIPITLGEWQMRLEARSYPPIGGYAEADVEESESNEFVVSFKGGGEFVIRPFIRKYYDESDWFGIDNKAKVVGTPTITVDDSESLFLTSPSLSNSGEILGKMNIAQGKKACIEIAVDVATSTSPLITKTLKRKIFVTQK